MKRFWLAAVLGILLGLGLAFAPATPVSPQPKTYLPIQPLQQQQQRTFEATVRQVSLDFQFTVLALLVGIVVAAPFFLLAKRRGG